MDAAGTNDPSSRDSHNRSDSKGLNRLIDGRHGTFVYNANDMYIGRSLEVYGEWAEFETAVFRQVIRPDDIVVDVGANLGAHAVFFAKAVGKKGRVYAFEPQRVVFQLLCANVALNGLLNVHCFHAAATSEPQAVIVPPIDYEVPNNFGHLQLGGRDFKGEGEPVVGTPLDAFKLPACRLLKVDVEGRELEVLQGATQLLKLRPLVFVENNNKHRSPELIRFLIEQRYRLYWHLSYFFNPNNFRGVTENVFGPIFDVNLIGVPEESPGEIANFPTVEGPNDTWEAAMKRSVNSA